MKKKFLFGMIIICVIAGVFVFMKKDNAEKEQFTCVLKVECSDILKNMDKLDNDKLGIIPEDGNIFAEKEVTFTDGENVFDVLERELKNKKIHFEFAGIPGSDSKYIKGIANIYEFDCGELSGWTYKVNSESPNVGAGEYLVKENDRIEWIYSCDLSM